MNPITIETSNYSTSDTNRGKVQLVCRLASESAVSPKIVATKAEVNRMAANLKETVLIQYTRDFIAPITAGEQIGTMTYFPSFGDPVVYSLTASRSVARRENTPKTLEEIISETYNDPNPFPPFSIDLALIFLAPMMLLGILILAIVAVRRKIKTRKMKTPKPINRYVK